MFAVSAKVDQSSMLAGLSDAEKRQIPFATARALTAVARKVKDAEVHEMRDSFDRPTPWTLNSLFLKPATKAELTAYVWLKDDRATSGGTPASVYLRPEIHGGARLPKKFERALASVGLLPAGFVAVPGSAAKLDQYGNMSKGQIVQILSYFRTFTAEGFSANITDKRKAKLAKGTKKKQGFAYFVGRPGDGKLPLGVYKRVHFAQGSAIKPILIFVDGALYQERYDFFYAAKVTVDRELPREMADSLKYALATAR